MTDDPAVVDPPLIGPGGGPGPGLVGAEGQERTGAPIRVPAPRDDTDDADDGPVDAVRLVLPDRLVFSGEVDPAAQRAFAGSGDRLAEVRSVSLTGVGFLSESGVAVLLRCLQQVHHRRPGARLVVVGACPRVLDHLELLGILSLLDVRDHEDR